MILVGDGGPDDRLNYFFVQVALIGLFKALDLDFLVSVRTGPYQSWKNLVERVMSTVNLALQSMSLCHNLMSPRVSIWLRIGAQSRRYMRLVADIVSSRTQERDSMALPMVAFSTRILALALKGENFVVNSAASDQEIKEFFNHNHFIQPCLDRAHLRRHN